MKKAKFIEHVYPISWFIKQKAFDKKRAAIMLKVVEKKRSIVILGNGQSSGISTLADTLRNHLAVCEKKPLMIPGQKIKNFEKMFKSKHWGDVKKITKYSGNLIWELPLLERTEPSISDLKRIFTHFDVMIEMCNVNGQRFLKRVWAKD